MTAPGSAAIGRAHKLLGREFELTNFQYDSDAGATPYADGDWVETDDSPVSVTATIDFEENPERSSGGAGGGVDVEQDAVIYVQTDSSLLSDGTGDNARATEFYDTDSGASYRAVSVEHQLHLTAVHVEQL